MLSICSRTSIPNKYSAELHAHACVQGEVMAQIAVSPVSSTVSTQAKSILSSSTTYSSSVFFFYLDYPKHTLRSLQMYAGSFWRKGSSWLEMWEGLVAENY